MKLTIFGATGRVGSEILKLAIQDGHDVKVLVRNPEKLKVENPLLQVMTGNVLNADSVRAAISRSDAVISTVGTDGTNTLSKSIPLILNAMKIENVKRIITIGTAGILQARVNPDIYRYQSSESRRKSTLAAEDHLAAYLKLAESDVDWTIICPTYLPEGNRKGNYRIERNFLPENGTSISIYDTADFAYAQLFTDEFLKCRVGICY